MANWSNPILTTQYDTFVTEAKDRDVDAATMFTDAPSNQPTGSIRYNRGTDLFEEWSGSAWATIPISIAGYGTGATTAAGARANLGLGTIAVQNDNAVAITGGTIGGTTAIGADRLTSNLVPTARLGSGTPSGFKFPNGSQAWAFPIPIGLLCPWLTASAPSGWLLLDGSPVSRTTYADLFALWGTTFGAGDGSTTFNLPDLRGKYLFGKATSGTGSTLNGTFGTIDHTHTGPSHTHDAGTLAGPSHTHSTPDHSHEITGVTTTGPSDIIGVDRNLDGIVQSVPVDIHTHGTPNSSTDSGGSGNTGSAGTGPVTGATAAAGTGATGGANPPSHVCNWIVFAGV